MPIPTDVLDLHSDKAQVALHIAKARTAGYEALAPHAITQTNPGENIGGPEEFAMFDDTVFGKDSAPKAGKIAMHAATSQGGQNRNI